MTFHKSTPRLQQFWNKLKGDPFFLVGFFILVGIVIWAIPSTDNSSTVSEEGEKINLAPPSSKDIRVGSDNALYQILIYTDYECPFCRDVDEQVPEWVREYGPSTVSFYFRHLPLVNIHGRALEFAKYVECTKRLYGDGVAFELGKFMYDHLQESMEDILSKFKIVEPVVSPQELNQCVPQEEIAEHIKDDVYEAVLNNIQRTPSFAIFDTQKNSYIERRLGGGVGIYSAYFRSFFQNVNSSPRE